MDNIIIQTVCRMVIPFIQMYGLYIIFHGHVSPGGSFSGGAILAASMIIYVLAFGQLWGLNKLPEKTSTMLESGGALWFLILGMAGILAGQSFLANRAAGFLTGVAGELFSSGLILLVTLGLGFKVASTLTSLFYKLAEDEDNE